MKKSIFNLSATNKRTALTGIIIGILIFFASATQTQAAEKVKIGSPLPWCAPGQAEVYYYYLPDVQAYFDVHTSKFIYHKGNRWVHRANLPKQYRGYDLYGGYKIKITGYINFYAHTNYAKVNYAKVQKTKIKQPQIDTTARKIALVNN